MTIRQAIGYIAVCDNCKCAFKMMTPDRGEFAKCISDKGWLISAPGRAAKSYCPECANSSTKFKARI